MLYAALVAAEALPVFQHAVAVSNCGMPWRERRVFTLDVGGTLRISLRDGKQVAELRGDSAVRWWAYSYGGNTVGIVRNGENTASIFDLSGKRLATLEHEGTVGGMWIAAKGARVLTWADNDVRLWDGKGAPRRTLTHKSPVHFARPGSEGRLILVSLTNQQARVYKDDGTLLGEWLPPELITGARWRPDDERLLTYNKHANVARLWDRTGKEIAVLGGHGSAITRARFSPDGNLIVTASTDGKVIMWNAAGQALGVIMHPAEVPSVGILPGGKLIVTTCVDGIARIWTRRGHLVAELHGHLRAVRNVGYSEAGDWLLTCSDDTTARLWPLDLKEALSRAAERAGRKLTPEEKKRYLDPR